MRLAAAAALLWAGVSAVPAVAADDAPRNPPAAAEQRDSAAGDARSRVAAPDRIIRPFDFDAAMPDAADSGVDPLLEGLDAAAAAPTATTTDAATDPDAGGPLAEMPPIDATLLEPLAPLAEFDRTPGAEFHVSEDAAQDVRYSVRVDGLKGLGLDGAFGELSGLKQGEGKKATAAQVAARANADKRLIERLLRSEGWYSAQVATEITPPEDGWMQVRFDVTPGRQYKWSEITLDLIPDDLPELAQGFGLHVGDAVDARQVEEAEGALLLNLQEHGYPFAEIGARDIVLSQSRPTASYFLTGDIGRQGVFGRVRLKDYAPFSEQHANVIARFRPGELYDTAMVDDLRRALIATQQFGGVAVKPVDTGTTDAAGRTITDIEVLGNEGPKRLLAGQLGYSSREGVRAEASWRHRSLVQPEGNFTARGVLGTQEQRLGVGLAMENWHQRDRVLSLGLDIANLTPPAYSAQTVDFNLTLGRQSTPIWQKRWTWSIGLNLGASRERPKAPDPDGERPHRNYLFASLPMMLGYDRSDDLLDPTRGYRLTLDASPELSRQGSSIEKYARLFLTGTAYQPFGESFVLAGRVRLGSIVGAPLDGIAPTRRIYAGGGGSVRGFEYQGIGVPGSDDRPVGGRGLFEGSLEGRYRFGNLGVVGFIDSGAVSAGSTPSLTDIRYGAGVGVRYYSSFGPMRFDIARAINRRPRDPVVAVYISIGQAF